MWVTQVLASGCWVGAQEQRDMLMARERERSHSKEKKIEVSNLSLY